MGKPFDATTKSLIEFRPEDWLALVGWRPRGEVRLINTDLSTVVAEADKVIEVNDPVRTLVHFELQASRDSSLPVRLLRYNVLLEYRHELPTLSVVVLLRPEADGPEMSGLWTRGEIGDPNYLGFGYQVVRVWDLPVEVFLQGGLGTLPLALLADTGDTPPRAIIQQIDDRLRHEATETEADTLWSSTMILMGLKFSAEITTALLRGVRGMRESVTYQVILEEGAAKGAIEECRKHILKLGRLRFGEPEPRISRYLAELSDLERLETLFDRVIQVNGWDDILSEFPEAQG